MKNIEKKELVLLEGDKEIGEMSLKFLKELIKLYKKNDCAYDYIVLTTRRCFCLYYALKKNSKLRRKNIFWFLINSKYLKQIEQKICSSQSVDIIGEKFKDCKVLLVDDIMIHGQTVYSYFERVSNYGAKDIDTIVLVRNIERPDYYYMQTKKDYIAIYNKVNWDWRDLSNKIVSYLHNVGQLYISYIYGHTVTKDILDIVTKTEKMIKCKEDFSRFIKHPVYCQGCQPEYYYISEYSKYKFIEYAFLRVYPIKNKSGIKYEVLPYIELSDFKTENIFNIWKSIWTSGVPKELESINCSKDIYKALTAILSYCLCEKLFGQNAIISTKEVDKSFVNNFLEIVKENLCEDPFAVFDRLYESVELIYDDSINSRSIMQSILNTVRFSEDRPVFDALETIKQYFYSVSAEEEEQFIVTIKKGVENVIKLKGKQMPIASSTFYKSLPDKYKIECLGFILYLLDNGVASHVVKTFDSEKYVITALKAGEQSYHLFSDLTGNAFKMVYFLLTELEKIRDIDRINYIKDRFINKLKEIGIQNTASIEYVLNKPPVNLRADYFGIIKLRNSCLTENEIYEEKRIMASLEEILLYVKQM